MSSFTWRWKAAVLWSVLITLAVVLNVAATLVRP